jgi:hypothetical protein
MNLPKTRLTGEDSPEYERSFLVKDLFDPKAVYGSFEVLEFQTLRAFMTYLGKGYLPEPDGNHELIVQLRTAEEVSLLAQILRGTDIGPAKRAVIMFALMTVEALDGAADLLDDSLSFCCLRVDPQLAVKLNAHLMDKTKNIRKFMVKNYAFIQMRINAENLNQQYEAVLGAMTTAPRIYYMDITIDYASFETQPISDLHRLRFFLGTIRNWTQIQFPQDVWAIKDGEVIVSGQRPEVWDLRKKQSCLRAFLNEQLDIYLTPFIAEGEKPYFEMHRWLEKDGNELPLRTMTKLRQILDVRFKKASFTNMYMIDLSQNLKIMKDPFMIPYLTSLCGEWLEV